MFLKVIFKTIKSSGERTRHYRLCESYRYDNTVRPAMWVKDFSCWKQYLCMAFGQVTHRETLRDTMLCLKANADKLYHLGIGDVVAKSTLSTANESCSYLIYYDLSMRLIQQAKQ